MPSYTVNATLTYIGWVYVDAKDELEALELADQMQARDFDIDPATGSVSFNITPQVEPVEPA